MSMSFACRSISDVESSEVEEFSEDELRNSDVQLQNGRAINQVVLTNNVSLIQQSGMDKKSLVVHFSPHYLFLSPTPEVREEAEKYHMAYKFVKTECKLVRNLLNSHCFREVHPNSSNFSMMWTGSQLNTQTLRGMQEFQKVNHFPRSYELTRKDRLYRNIQRMQQAKGSKHFDFIPESYVLPEEFNEFYQACIKRDKGPWIVKPVALSRGRGIYLVNHPSQVPLDERLLVCRYINNPLLIDGYKFDLRLYIAVTSFDPLRIYLYEEGLTRFATVKYDRSGKNITNSCMHLTNYSVNKKNPDFISCPDPAVENYGSKWSLSAMLRYLKKTGKNTEVLMMRIEDLVVKTVISGELPIASACRMFMPFLGNCFELYGFDVLVDDSLRPWLLEVNLSPSLNCDSPLDLKIKSHMVSDMFNMAGFIAHDPMLRKPTNRRLAEFPGRGRYQRYRSTSAGSLLNIHAMSSSRPSSGVKRKTSREGLTMEETRIVRQTRDEYAQRGGFVRMFPTPDSWELYGSFLEHKTTHNQMLHSRLFPDRKTNSARPSTANLTSTNARATTIAYYAGTKPSQSRLTSELIQSGYHISDRIMCYERKLDSWSPSLLPSKTAINGQASTCEATSNMAPSENSSQTSLSARDKPDGHAVNFIEEQVPLTTDSVVGVTGPVCSRDELHSKLPSAVRRQTRTTPVNTETVSKKVLSVQAGYKSVRIQDIVNKAASLTKLQARQAFAMYLQRVQQRLMQEASYESDDYREEVDSSKPDEQMNLVVRFLKKAASNLQQPFKVVVPNMKLPVYDRKRILAKQLEDFVRVYGKETAELQKRDGAVRPRGPNSNNGGSLSETVEEDFKIFMAIASETELEEILTQYTKQNKNASVFLGGKELDARVPRCQDAGRSRQMECSSHKTRSTEDLSSTYHVTNRHTRALSAVSAYGASISLNRKTQRPASAKLPCAQATIRRPVSATATGPWKTGRESHSSGAHTRQIFSRNMTGSVASNDQVTTGRRVADEHAVSVALQRLATRQAARQYCAHNKSSGRNWPELFSKMEIRSDSDHDGSHYARHLSADSTFETFINHDAAPRAMDVPTTVWERVTAGHSFTGSSRVHKGQGQVHKEGVRENIAEEKIYVAQREEYNRQTRVINQKQADEKAKLQQQRHPYVPRPPHGPKRPVSGKPITRLAAPNSASARA